MVAKAEYVVISMVSMEKLIVVRHFYSLTSNVPSEMLIDALQKH